MDALDYEMKTVRVALESFEGLEGDLPIGYQNIGCLVIWDVNIVENFRRKYRLVPGGHTTTTPMLSTYS